MSSLETISFNQAGVLPTKDAVIIICNQEPVQASRKLEEGSGCQNAQSSFYEKGVRITFKNVTFSATSSTSTGDTKFLLKDVSGWFEPMQMTALMGPSGSGKTTLLDILAGRKNSGKLEGQLLFGGCAPTAQFLRRYTGYVEQFDTLVGTLTVAEMLLYTAELKQSIREPLSSKKAAVAQLLNKLALEPCKDVLIGDKMIKGISGGQAKRTNIGIALITNPRVLFLDEPTSGLDSFTSNEVMMVVKQLVNDGVTICAAIHSPTAYCFNLFDRLMMLVRGRVVYHGPRGDSTSFAKLICPKLKDEGGYNDAEYMVDLIAEADRQGQGELLADAYDNSALKHANDSQLDLYMEEKELHGDLLAELNVGSSTVTPWWWGVRTLLKYRTARNYMHPVFLGSRLADKLVISLLLMAIYWNVGKYFQPDNYTNVAAVLFMWCALPAFGAAAYTPSLVLERALFIRERNDGLYYVITYLLAKLIEELLLAFVASVGIAAYVFYGCKFQGLFSLFWLVYFATLANGIVLAYLVAALAPDSDTANALLPSYVMSLLFFAGCLLRFSDMPNYSRWYSYIDFLRYSWGALMKNQYSGAMGDPVWQQGMTVLQYYELDGINQWAYLLFLSLFFVVYFLAAWAAMSVLSYRRR